MDTANSRYRWIIVAVTMVNQALVLGVILYSFALFSIPWLEEFGMSRGQLMLSIVIFQIINSLISPYLGQKLDGMPLLWPVILGYIIISVGLGILAIANAYWQVIAVYALLFSFGNTLSGTFVSQLLINRWFQSDKGLALGISATGTSLGGVLFPLIIAQALSTVSLSVVFQAIALLSLFVLLPLNFLILRVNPPEQKSEAVSASGETPVRTWTTQEILRSAAFWIPLSVLIPISTGFVAVQANLGAHLNDLSYPASFTGQMIALIAIMMVVGKLLYGKLADNLDHRYLFVFMGVFSALSYVLLLFGGSKLPLLTSAALLGLSGGGLIPMMGVSFAARFGMASFGKVMGLVVLTMIIGSLGPIYAAWIYDMFASYDYAFISFILFIVPGMLLMKMLPPPLDEQKSEKA